MGPWSLPLTKCYTGPGSCARTRSWMILSLLVAQRKKKKQEGKESRQRVLEECFQRWQTGAERQNGQRGQVVTEQEG